MRVGLFTTLLPDDRRKIGGVEIFVHRLGNALVDRGHDVFIYSFAPRPPPDARYVLRRVGPPALAGSRARRLTLCPAALNRVQALDIDVLNLHGDDWFYFRRRVATVRTFHGSALRESQSATRWQRRLLQAMVFPLELGASRLATASYTVCAGMPGGYRLDGVLPQGGGLFPSMVDRPTRLEREAAPTVLFVGTWEGRKRGRWLRDVFYSDVLPFHPTARLVMVSDHCEESAHVVWKRSPDDRALSELYARAWVFCLPSTYEGFGQPYVEAMAHGTPVVATPNPGSNYVSRGGAAALIAEDAQLGRSLCRVLSDYRWRESLAALGMRRAADFGWERACEAHEVAFTAAMASHDASDTRVPG